MTPTVADQGTSCRVCGSPSANKVGDVEYYSGFAWSVYNCVNCRSRFTEHDESIYDRLHSKAASRYGSYREIADNCKHLFEKRDLEGLRGELFRWASKYKFIIESVERGSKDARLLEIGCSRGYLSSFFILSGYQITGFDVSPEAVASAKSAFGDHFVMADSAAISAGAPYDVIYHVGMIGCVGDPVGLTHGLLKMLKPGGRLLFNAPNADSCYLKRQLWIDSAPPPDVVTLFAPGFWHRHYSEVAEVVEEVETDSPPRSVAITLRRLFGRKWRVPMPRPLDGNANNGNGHRPVKWGVGERVWSRFERGVVKVGNLTRLSSLSPRQPTEFGLFVTMTKKQ